MDEKSFKSITNSIANIEKTINDNKESNAKVMLYLIGKHNEVEEKIAGINDEIESLKDSLEKALESIGTLEARANEAIAKSTKDIESISKGLSESKAKTNDMIKEVNDFSSRLDNIGNIVKTNSIDNTKYLVLDKQQLENKTIKKAKDKLYKIFHYRKIKRKLMEEKLEEERKQRELEQLKTERQLAEEKRKAEEKQKKEAEIRNILNGMNKKH